MNTGERFLAAARSLMLLYTPLTSLSLFDSQADEVAGRKASVHEALSAISEVQLRALFNFHECHDDQIHHSGQMEVAAKSGTRCCPYCSYGHDERSVTSDLVCTQIHASVWQK